jgi:hypothetical protein
MLGQRFETAAQIVAKQAQRAALKGSGFGGTDKPSALMAC